MPKDVFSVGVDIGVENTKAVLAQPDGIAGHIVISGENRSAEDTARDALDQLLRKANVKIEDVGNNIAATGSGRYYLNFIEKRLPESICIASGIHFLMPKVRTVLSMGAQRTLAVSIEEGYALRTATSDKCAMGSGRYLEMVAELLGLPIEQMAETYFASEAGQEVTVESTCAVFAESEIISLIHAKAHRADILRGVLKAVARRTYPLLLDVGIQREVAVVGGVAQNRAVIAAIENALGFNVVVPEQPLIVGALGAAILTLKEIYP